MLAIYNIGLWLYRLAVQLAALTNEKARLFIGGRKNLLPRISEALRHELRPKVWIHCASLGEFEQGRPVIEAIKKQHAEYCIVLTFFSPSGYEVRKNYPHADYIFYLPLDGGRNAKRFLDIVKPECALFVKYEFWYHYLYELKRRSIPVLLFSAIFQPRHPFFKWYGTLHREMLGFFQHIFVQDAASLQLLYSIQVRHASLAGDTRLDRAIQVAEDRKSFPAVINFKGQKHLLVAGSTWPEDEQLLQKYFASSGGQYKLLLAPHEANEEHISQLLALFGNDSVALWTDEVSNPEADIFIVNTIGHLSHLYQYADAVWIGGGFTKTGIHNIIEPAVFGAPIAFGPNYSRYQEAKDLLAANAAFSTDNADGLKQWLSHEKALQLQGRNAQQYVHAQRGATQKIMDYLASEKCFLSTAKKF